MGWLDLKILKERGLMKDLKGLREYACIKGMGKYLKGRGGN